MARHRIYDMSFASVYPHYLAKAEKKGRTRAELDQVISDISPRVLANTVPGYTMQRIEGLPLTIRSDRDRNVINVYYEPQIYVTILDLEVPTGASLGGLNVGDCSE